MVAESVEQLDKRKADLMAARLALQKAVRKAGLRDVLRAAQWAPPMAELSAD